MKLMELARRRLQLGTDLLSDRNSLEFDLHRLNTFNKLADKTRLFDMYFGEWQYRIKGSFWGRVTASLGSLWAGIKGVFSSYRYFRLVTTQRRAAYIYYGLIILIFILLAVYVPSKWNDHTQDLYEQFEQRAAQPSPGGGK